MGMQAAMMVAPNLAQIRATVLHAAPSPQSPGKWMLEIEILAVQPVNGPQAARPGMRAQAFALQPAWDLPVPAQVEADAEYVGGPGQLLFRLKNLRVCD